ncbi:MAG: AgmX/PglI C-terminal domain-containing protein [Polyangiaceae bacterium]
MRARGYLAMAGLGLLLLGGSVYLSLRAGRAVAAAASDLGETNDAVRRAALERTNSDDLAPAPSGAVTRATSPRERITPEQRERARRAREQIQEAARRWSRASDGTHAGGNEPGSHEPSGNEPSGNNAPPPVLDRDYIQKHIRENFFPLARDCYQSLLRSQPKSGGTVEIHMSVVGDENIGGVVESVELGEKSTMQDADFLDCVSESMMSMVFEPPPEHGSVTIVYPVLFAPADAG